MGKVNIKQLNVAPASGYVIGSGAGGVPIWKLESSSVDWSNITGNQAVINLSGFTNDSGFITLGSLSAGTGISYNNLTGAITNSAPDQTVVLTQGTGITITGTYPNFTITNNSPALNLDLQDVLDNGNTAEQSITLTTGVDATMTFINAGMLAQFQLKYVDFSAENNYIEIGNIATLSGTRIYEPAGGGENAFLSTLQGINSTLRFLSGYSADADVTFRSITGTVALLGDNISSFTNNSGYITSAAGLAANSITDGLIRQSAGLSVIGRSANSTGNVADITAATDLHVLRRSGTSIGFGLLTGGSMSLTANYVPFGVAGVMGSSANLQFNGAQLGVGGAPSATLDVHTGSGGAGAGIRIIQNANNGVANISYSSIDFQVPTTGLIGQFLATASNFTAAGLDLAANSIALAAYNGQLSFASSNASGYITFHTGGYALANRRMTITNGGQIGIGQPTPVASAKVEIVSTTQGLLPPRGTNAQMLAIASPAAGLMFYDTTNNQMNYYNGSTWIAF